jgi:hypothetical protein
LPATQADNRSVANGAIFLVIFLNAFAQAVSSVPCQINTKLTVKTLLTRDLARTKVSRTQGYGLFQQFLADYLRFQSTLVTRASFRSFLPSKGVS